MHDAFSAALIFPQPRKGSLLIPNTSRSRRGHGHTLTESCHSLIGSGLRLPDRRAVIELVKEVRRLLFPLRLFQGPLALMSQAPENYAALQALERICEKSSS